MGLSARVARGLARKKFELARLEDQENQAEAPIEPHFRVPGKAQAGSCGSPARVHKPIFKKNTKLF